MAIQITQPADLSYPIYFAFDAAYLSTDPNPQWNTASPWNNIVFAEGYDNLSNPAKLMIVQQGEATLFATDGAGSGATGPSSTIFGERPRSDGLNLSEEKSNDTPIQKTSSCSQGCGPEVLASPYVRVNSDFSAALKVSCSAIQTLGSHLNLCFSRINGNVDSSPTNGLPMGTGGGAGGRLDLYRDVSYFAFAAGGGVAVVGAGDGSQLGYALQGTVGSDELWLPSPAMEDSELLHLASGEWREKIPTRTYFEYDTLGRLYHRALLNGAELFYSYNNNRVASITGDLPGTVYFEYNGSGLLSRVVHGALPLNTDTERVWQYEYENVSGLGTTLAQITGPNLCVTYFGCDSQGHVQMILDPENYASYYEYDDHGQIARAIPPSGTPTEFRDYRNGALMRYTESPQLATYYTHDGRFARITASEYGAGTTAKQVFYDARATIQSWMDLLSRTNYYAYDSQLNVTRALDASNNSAYFRFDANNKTTRSVDKRWREFGSFAKVTTYFEYDSGGNPTRIVDPFKNATTMSFIRGGLMTKVRDARGNATYFDFDAYGRQTRKLDAKLASSYFGYDSFGNQMRAVNPRWTEQSSFAKFTTYYEYDALNRKTREVGPGGQTTQTDYTARCDQSPIARYELASGVWRATYFGYDGLGRQIKVVDPRKFVATKAYLGATNLVSQRSDYRNFPTYYFYDSQQRLVATQDALQHATYYSLDPVGNTTASVSPRWIEKQSFGAFATYYGFDSLNRQVRTVGPAGNSAYYGFDAVGNQVQSVGPRWQETGSQAQFTTYFAFDALNRRTTSLDPLKHVTYFEFDEVGNNTLRVDHISESLSSPHLIRPLLLSGDAAYTYFGYNQINQLVKLVDALGNTQYYEYDAAGNQVKTISPAALGDLSFSIGPAQQGFSIFDTSGRLTGTVVPSIDATYFIYDDANNTSAQVNPRGYVTKFGYDEVDEQVRVLDALGNSTYFQFDAEGNRTAMVRPRWKEYGDFVSQTTYYEFDAVGNLSRAVDAQLSAFLQFYDSDNNLTVKIPPMGGAVYFGYDTRDLGTVVTDGVFNVAYFEHDLAGNTNKIVSPRGFASAYGYDELNRIARSVDSEGRCAYFGYDIGGNLNVQVDGLFRATYFIYNKLDQLTSIVNAAGITAATFFYDAAGNMYNQYDANDNFRYYFYDADNRVSQAIVEVGNASAPWPIAYFGYDQNSNLARTSDANGTPIYFGYDALDRLARIQYPSQNQYFEYDAGGNLNKTVDKWGTGTFGFDKLGRITQRNTPAPQAGGDSVYYTYDAVSNLTRLGYNPESPGATPNTQYVYDPAQRQVQMTSTTGFVSYYGYDASSNLARSTFRSGACYYTYDRSDRVTSIRYVNSSGTPLAYFDYAWDNASRITAIARETNLAIYYSYDALDRLTAELWRKQSDYSQIYGFWYNYDPAGNRTRMRREFGAGAEWESAYFAYDLDSSLTRRRSVLPPAAAVDTYFYYDNNGSLTKMWDRGVSGATYFSYGPHGLITGITPAVIGPSGVYAWAFDYDSRLTRNAFKRELLQGYYYLWDGLNILEEKHGAFLTKRMSYEAQSPIYGVGNCAEINVIGDTQYTPLMDHRGTSHVLMNAAGSETGRRYYDAFGVILGQSGNWNNDFGYQSNWFTVKIGPNWWGLSPTRVYDFSTGRFVGRDVAPTMNRVYRHSFGSSQAIGIYANTVFARTIQRFGSWATSNLYSYVNQALLSHVDPTGLYKYLDNGKCPNGWTIKELLWAGDASVQDFILFVNNMRGRFGGRAVGIYPIIDATAEKIVKGLEMPTDDQEPCYCLENLHLAAHRGGPYGINTGSLTIWEWNGCPSSLAVYGQTGPGQIGQVTDRVTSVPPFTFLGDPTQEIPGYAGMWFSRSSIRELGQILSYYTCDPCSISIYGCDFGANTNAMAILAKESGCTVYAGTKHIAIAGRGAWAIEKDGRIIGINKDGVEVTNFLGAGQYPGKEPDEDTNWTGYKLKDGINLSWGSVMCR
ncbi:MAG TPA: hypothetical protein VKX17_19720 [Planctomycetota bacterium]|nr:hypothetical protein [Planctomycetota bacterium]